MSAEPLTAPQDNIAIIDLDTFLIIGLVISVQKQKEIV